MSKEAILINRTITILQKQLENPELTDLEKEAKNFYINELSNIVPCPDEEIFVKPCANFRGRTTPARVTDREVFQKFIRSTPEGKLRTTADGHVRPETCRFRDFESYLKYITGEFIVYPHKHNLYEGMTQDEYINFYTPRSLYNSYKEY